MVVNTFREGLWSQLLTFANLFFALLMAINYFEPCASLLVSMWRGIYWFAPGLCYWALFAIFLGIGRFATDALSRVKVAFYTPIEYVGRVLLALSVAVFTLCAVHIGFMVSNLPIGVFTNANAEEVAQRFESSYKVPMYQALTGFSRTPLDERSAKVLLLPLKYFEFRKAYASVEGMMAR